MRIGSTSYDGADEELPLVSTSNNAIILVGSVTGPASELLIERTGVAEVHARPSTRAHWRKHSSQFDVLRAERMLPCLLADPLKIVQGKDHRILVLVENFDDAKYLAVAVKCLAEKSEAWISTMFPFKKSEFNDRGWVKKGLLYERK
jgi:hypothetical protein